MNAERKTISLETSQLRRRLFVDHTHTTQFQYQTGVQRVVRKIIEHVDSVSLELFDDVIPVMLSDHGFHPEKKTSPLVTPTLNAKPKKRWTKRLPRWMRRPFRWGRRASGNAWDSNPTENRVPTANFREGDILLLPDAYWAFPMVWPWVCQARQAGAITAVIIYDLIPHMHSEIYGEEGAEGFRNYIRKAFDHADCFIAISKTVRDQLRQELPSITGKPLGNLVIDSFELGAEFEDTTGNVQEKIVQQFSGSDNSRPLLMVGTIEARKNHHFVLDTMEQLWNINPDRRLCIVGRPGWKGESVVERIQSHPRFQKQLFWIDNASDADLLHCYKNAKGVVFSSIAEGFGLPIVESLWHNCETFVSDTGIHREVGKDQCWYFDLERIDSLLSLLLAREGDNQFTNTPFHKNVSDIPFRPTSWQVSVQGLVEKIDFARSILEPYNDSHCRKTAA